MTTHRESSPDPSALPIAPVATRSASIVILLSAIFSIIFVALDPQASGKDPAAVLQSMVQIHQVHLVVHIVAMICVLGFMYGYTVLSQQLGLRRPSVLVGLICYGFGSVLMLIATVIDGLISTDMAAAFVHGSPEAIKAGYWMIMAMSGVALTDIARVAWVFQSLAAVSWSLALLRVPGLQRNIGIFGLLVGCLPTVAVFAAGMDMTATVVVGILLVQAAWNVAAAVLLMRIQSKGALRVATKTALFKSRATELARASTRAELGGPLVDFGCAGNSVICVPHARNRMPPC
jgi:hypothetical protein